MAGPSHNQSDSAVHLDATGLRVAVVVSRYNESITDRLLQGARAAFLEAGGVPEELEVFRVPGAFELPTVAGAAVRSGRFDAVVTLGCLIRGETVHDRVIADAAAHAIAALSTETGVPVAFGVLTVQTEAQAHARAAGEKGDKGMEAMVSAIETVHTLRAVARTKAVQS